MMSKTIKNAGYVMFAAGVLMILATAVGFAMTVEFGEFRETVLEARSYVAVVPGIATISLGRLIARYDASRTSCARACPDPRPCAAAAC